MPSKCMNDLLPEHCFQRSCTPAIAFQDGWLPNVVPIS